MYDRTTFVVGQELWKLDGNSNGIRSRSVSSQGLEVMLIPDSSSFICFDESIIFIFSRLLTYQRRKEYYG